ncbi:hypothetical protein [Chryseobacterium sp. JUb7]|uniref:hypothetical protein n=1 Tax=Chryseobacterium sp. JUb7 TaxID=2940599 RepID=UPI00216AB0D0|nr:hypothetical protein [Chryseobacterium sp. JUb7]MCS3529749.1 hypothetical protein [Chryseobacterium sp. JUb7]
MKYLPLVLIIFSITSCSKQENISIHHFEIGKVKFNYPSDWTFTEMEGIDTYISYLSKNGDTIWIEYGRYNPKIYKNPLQNNLFRQITIDGKEAIFETSKNKQAGLASVYIPKTDSTSGLYMYNKKGNTQDVLDIYKTIKLGKSIRKESLIINQFKDKKSPPGIVFYENNCLSCHSEYRFEIGPQLDQKFIQSKGKLWLKNYIYSKKQSMEYGIQCSQIEKQDSSSVNQMLKYLFQK